MLGGCRSSLETGVRRDGWRTLADTLGALNISVLSVCLFFCFFFVGGAGRILLRLGHLNNHNAQSSCIAYENVAVLWRNGGRGSAEACTGDVVPRPAHSANLLKRSTDGWEGNLNVFSRGLRLNCRIFSVPAQHDDQGTNLQWPLLQDVIQFFGHFFSSFVRYV